MLPVHPFEDSTLPLFCMTGAAPKKGVLLSSSDSEDELFRKSGPTDTPPPGYSSTNGSRHSNNSSLVSGLIPQ